MKNKNGVYKEGLFGSRVSWYLMSGPGGSESKIRDAIDVIHRAFTKSPVNRVDVITLEAVPREHAVRIVTASGHLYNFDARALLNYCVVSNRYINPATLEVMSELDIRRLRRKARGTLTVNPNTPLANPTPSCDPYRYTAQSRHYDIQYSALLLFLIVCTIESEEGRDKF
jgi:hypothetical protein